MLQRIRDVTAKCAKVSARTELPPRLPSVIHESSPRSGEAVSICVVRAAIITFPGNSFVSTCASIRCREDGVAHPRLRRVRTSTQHSSNDMLMHKPNLNELKLRNWVNRVWNLRLARFNFFFRKTERLCALLTIPSPRAFADIYNRIIWNSLWIHFCSSPCRLRFIRVTLDAEELVRLHYVIHCGWNAFYLIRIAAITHFLMQQINFFPVRKLANKIRYLLWWYRYRATPQTHISPACPDKCSYDIDISSLAAVATDSKFSEPHRKLFEAHLLENGR